MDNLKMGSTHWWVLGLVAAGYFCDVIDYTILGALIPDMVNSKFMSPEQGGLIGTATLLGLFIGALGQGEFTDRFGRKAVYQFNLLLFGLATIAGAWSPSYEWLVAFRFLAGLGLGAEQPLCFSYTAEYAPKRIRGRIIALMQFIGGAWPWPIGAIFVFFFRDAIGWRGIWTVIGVLALVIFVLRFSLPESPRWLATHGQGRRALDLLQRLLWRGAGPRQLAAEHDHQVARVHGQHVAAVHRRHQLGIPARQRVHDVRAGEIWPQADGGRRLHPRRAGGHRCRAGELGRDVHRHDLHHDVLHPTGRQFLADFYRRGVPDQCARLRFWARAVGRPHRQRGDHPRHPDPDERLWRPCRVHRDRGLGGNCRLRCDPCRPRGARRGARRGRAADGVGPPAAKSCRRSPTGTAW